MKKKIINLNHLLTEEEINKFEEIYFSLVNNDKIENELKPMSFWTNTGMWLSKTQKRDELIETIIKPQQDYLREGYRKILEPFVKKGYKISPILGTLLGLYRNGTIIKHDDDLDLGIDISDYSRIRKKIARKAFFNGWTMKKGFVFVEDDINQIQDVVGKLYGWKRYTYQIGKLTFRSLIAIDLWPMAKIPNGNEQECRSLYQIHIFNLLSKNNYTYTTQERAMTFIENNLKEYALEIWNDENSKVISLKWMEEFIKSVKIVNDQNRYIPLEKDMGKIPNFTIDETKVVDGMEMYWPNIDDEYLTKMYGNWREEKITHVHIFRYSSVKVLDKNTR